MMAIELITKPSSFRWLTTSIFLALSAFGVYVIQVHFIASQGNEALEHNLYNKNFLLNVLAAFFKCETQPGTVCRQFTIAFAADLAAFVALTELEAVRVGASPWLRFTVFWGILHQMVGAGIIAPIYFAVFLSAYPSPRSSRSMITPTGANAVLFAMIFGYAPPVLAMFFIGDSAALVLSQFTPIYVWGLRELYMATNGDSDRRSPSKSTAVEKRKAVSAPAWKDGFTETMRIYLLVLHLSTYIHIQFILIPVFRSGQPLGTLKELFIPSLSIPASETTTVLTGVHHFLQWDMIMIMGSSFLAGIWDLDLLTKLRMIAWVVVATPVASPGTALASVWVWREKLLKDIRLASAAR